MGIADWLRGLPDDSLSTLLEARPDAAVPPPSDFGVLASRLTSLPGSARALERVDLFVIEMLSALAILPSPASPDAVADVLGSDPRRAVDAALGLAFGWQDEAGGLHLVPAVRQLLGLHPLGLGRPVAELLVDAGATRLQTMIRSLGIREAPSSVVGLRSAIAEMFADAARLDALLAGLPPQERSVLERLAAGPPTGSTELAYRLVPLQEAATSVERLLAQALLVGVEWEVVELPREVGLRLRSIAGQAPAGTVHPEPPELSAAPATTRSSRAAAAGGAGSAGSAGSAVNAVDDASAAAAATAVRLVEALLEHWDEQTPTLTRAGGLAVRDLRAAAKALGVEPDTVATLAETASAAGLVASSAGLDAAVMPTERFDAWRTASLADRWATLAVSWLGMDRLPRLVGEKDERGKGYAVFSWDLTYFGSAALRREVLDALAAAPKGAAVDPDGLANWLYWRAPFRGGERREVLAGWHLADAELLGLTGRGALSSAGRVLLGEPPLEGALAAALAPRLPAPVDHLLIQADLTAVAPGPLVPELARRLEVLADVESAGAATVYRFSEASIRRAFDAGWARDEVAGLLDTLAKGGVPQGLAYLVDDVARRHGRLRAGAVSSYLRCDEPGLLAEVVATRKVAPLGLRTVAPTVAVSAAPLTKVLELLRAAGFAPAAEASDGAVTIARAPRHRVPAPPRTASRTPSSGQTLPPGHAVEAVARLRRLDRRRAPAPEGRRASLATHGDLVMGTTAVLARLHEAVRSSELLWMSYVNAEGRASERIVHPIMFVGGHLTAFDEESGEKRSFALSRIQALAAVADDGEDAVAGSG